MSKVNEVVRVYGCAGSAYNMAHGDLTRSNLGTELPRDYESMTATTMKASEESVT